MRIKSKLFHDILRDKGSRKYSITKFLALVFSAVLIVYLGVVLGFGSLEMDHGFIIELMALIAALVGLKNGWGRRSGSSDVPPIQEPQVPAQERTVEGRTDDGAVF